MTEHTDSPTRLRVSEQLEIPAEELQFRYVRSSGPGGQNVNKVNSCVQLAWNLNRSQCLPPDVMDRLKAAERGRISKAGVLRIAGQRFRDRERNRQDCLDRLQRMVTAACQPPTPRRATKTPRRAQQARLKNKQFRADLKRSRRPPSQDD